MQGKTQKTVKKPSHSFHSLWYKASGLLAVRKEFKNHVILVQIES